jgi:hypothetical protein
MLSDALTVGAGSWFGAADPVRDNVTVTVRASALPGLVVWAVRRLRRSGANPK